MTAALLQFVEANPTDPRVVRLMKALDRPLTMNGNLGRLVGELMRELAA